MRDASRLCRTYGAWNYFSGVYPALPSWAKCVPRLRRLSEVGGKCVGQRSAVRRATATEKKNDVMACAKHLRSSRVVTLAQAEAYATERRRRKERCHGLRRASRSCCVVARAQAGLPVLPNRIARRCWSLRRRGCLGRRLRNRRMRAGGRRAAARGRPWRGRGDLCRCRRFGRGR